MEVTESPASNLGRRGFAVSGVDGVTESVSFLLPEERVEGISKFETQMDLYTERKQ